MSRKRERGIDRRFALEAATIRSGLQTDEPQRNRTPRHDDRRNLGVDIHQTNVRMVLFYVIVGIAVVLVTAAK